MDMTSAVGLNLRESEKTKPVFQTFHNPACRLPENSPVRSLTFIGMQSIAINRDRLKKSKLQG